MSKVTISSEAFANLNRQISENAERLKQRYASKYAIYEQNQNGSETGILKAQKVEKNSSPLRGKPMSLHNYAQTYLGPDAVYSLHSLSKFQTAAGVKQYAGKVYDIASNLNEEPHVLLDFMHKNNRNFDFKI